MSFLIVLAALCFLMFVAYRGYSVILFAPVAALGAVLLTDPSLVAPMFTGLFMDKMVGFLKLYFPVFLLGAIFITAALGVFIAIACMAGFISDWLKGSSRAQVLLNRLAGLVFTALALRLATASR